MYALLTIREIKVEINNKGIFKILKCLDTGKKLF